jgi:DNA polymerase/3'-5' exonuclease PolX
MTDHKKNIIREFTLLLRKEKSDRTKGWQFKVKNYQKVISYLSIDNEIDSTEVALELLRKSGMKLPNENPTKWKSKILLKIDKIIKDGSLDLELDPKLDILDLLGSIPEVGPSKAKSLYELGIHSLEDLKNKPELLNRKQLIGFNHMDDLREKIPRDEMTIWGKRLSSLVTRVIGDSQPIRHMGLVGSYRRGKQESGDIDFYIALPTTQKGLMNKIYKTMVDEGYIVNDDWFSKGEKKLMAVARLGMNKVARHLDIFIYPVEEYPFALLYATGSGEFNINMRNFSRKKGYSLSDKALLVSTNKGDPVGKDKYQELIGKDYVECEQDIFRFLGLEYLEPNNRIPQYEFPL